MSRLQFLHRRSVCNQGYVIFVFQKLESNMNEVKEHERKGEQKVKAVEEMLKQTEEDADKEIIELKTR